MKAIIRNANVIRLGDLPIGRFAQGLSREDSNKQGLFIRTELRSADGTVLSVHLIDLLNPKDQYPDKINPDQLVRMTLPGDVIEIHVT